MTKDVSQLAKIELRSYGRRRGRKRSVRQQQIFETGLARWGIDDVGEASQLCPRSLFAHHPEQIWLEIGFGGGEHLIWQAQQHPNIGFIGAEPFEDGVVKVLSAIEDLGLTNIRVFPGDVRQLLRVMPTDSIQRTFILFPDPWPKARHHKRRLVAGDLLKSMSRILVDDAELRVATDINAYAASILHTVHCNGDFAWRVARPADWRMRPQDWPPTRYETKARRDGRRPYFFVFRHYKSGKHRKDS